MLSPGQYVPQCVPDRRPLIMWSLVVVGALLFVGLLVLAPLAQANGLQWFSFAVYEAFSHVCHQAPERSLYIAGYPLAVCARCTGLYVGFAAGVAFYPVMTSLKRTHAPERKWLFIAAAPLGIDFGLGFLGIWENSHISRLLTGALLGFVSVFFIMPGLVQLSLYQRLFGPGSAKQSELEAARSPATSEQVTAAPSDYGAPLRRI
ncbi:MAG: DUF2085 domain-containing protein [Pyrinomonadaceae bacterium]|nr:DUF2085 domain-containing protein [Pyrinomonadaceae bacterium]